MANEKTKVKIDVMGHIWAMGWLFTLGFLGLGFWKGLLAIIVWPYYIGEYISKLVSWNPNEVFPIYKLVFSIKNKYIFNIYYIYDLLDKYINNIYIWYGGLLWKN